jgi:hypothetical protein
MSDCEGEEANENITSALPTRKVRCRVWSKTGFGDGGFCRQRWASSVTSRGVDGTQARMCRGGILASGPVPRGVAQPIKSSGLVLLMRAEPVASFPISK